MGAIQMTAREASPYVGPRPFEVENQDLFFGRDKETYALASLTIVAAGVLPVILLSRMAARSRPGQAGEAATARVRT